MKTLDSESTGEGRRDDGDKRVAENTRSVPEKNATKENTAQKRRGV